MSLLKTQSAGPSDSAHHRLHLLKPKKRHERFYTEGPAVQFKEGETAKKPLPLNRRHKSKSQNKHYGASTGMEVEVVAEENLNLKKFINQLQSQLTVQRRKVERGKKKTTKMTKQLNRQFQKELYYSGKTPNAYLISGVKLQYEKAQQLYEVKCQELQELQRHPSNTNLEEMKTYITVLEEQNTCLKVRIEALEARRQNQGRASRKGSAQLVRKVYRSDQTGEVSKPEGGEEQLLRQLEKERIALGNAHQLIQRYSEKCKQYEKVANQNGRKVKFLERLIIQKDNNEHRARKECSKVARQLDGMLRLRKQELIDFTQTQQSLEQQILKLKEQEERRAASEREVFQKALQQKDGQILRLEKEIRYLSNMLTYWKPLDPRAKGMEDSHSRQQQAILIVGSESNGERGKESVPRENNASISSDLPVLQSIDMIASVEMDGSPSHHTSRIFEKSESFPRNNASYVKSSSQYNLSGGGGQVMPQWCGMKHREEAVKRRKVDINSIKQVGRLMRYRVIGSNVSIEAVKSLLDGQDEYISMGEVKKVLMEGPFCLDEEEARQVSRYTVQSCDGEWVWEDQLNQIQRSIAKSILRAFIGEYRLGSGSELGQWKQIVSHYGHNLNSVYTTIAPSGIISLSRFLQVLKGLGIELEEELEDWVIGKMAVESVCLDRLKYSVVISQ